MVLLGGGLRYTCIQVHVLILVTVEASTGMYKDCWGLLRLVSNPKHQVESAICAMWCLCHYGGGFGMVTACHSWLRRLKVGPGSIRDEPGTAREVLA